MKITLLLAMCSIILAGCVSSKVSVTPVGDNGDLTGVPKITIPKGMIVYSTKTIKNKETGISSQKPELSVRYSNDGDVYLITPQRRRWVETQLAPTYQKDSTIMTSLGVETKDKRAEFAKQIVDLAAAAGGDLTFLDASRSTCPNVSYEQLGAMFEANFMTNNRSADGPKIVTYPGHSSENNDGGTGKCTGKMTISPVPADAATKQDFLNYTKNGKKDVTIVPYAACREVEVDIKTHLGTQIQATLAIPDLRYVRVQQLPLNGKISFESVCSTPSIEAEGSQMPDDFGQLIEVVKLLQNPEDNTSTSSDTSKPNTNGSGN